MSAAIGIGLNIVNWIISALEMALWHSESDSQRIRMISALAASVAGYCAHFGPSGDTHTHKKRSIPHSIFAGKKLFIQFTCQTNGFFLSVSSGCCRFSESYPIQTVFQFHLSRCFSTFFFAPPGEECTPPVMRMTDFSILCLRVSNKKVTVFP